MASWAVWRLPLALRWYVTAVIAAAAAAAGTAAAMTSWQSRDALLFGLLACFGAVVVEFTRHTAEPARISKEVHAAWQLPMALLLPPVYCLLAPAITIGLLQLRTRRTIAHRRVFSVAANGLSLGAASITFHALPATAGRPLLWVLSVTGCALLWSAVNKALVMTAVCGSDRTVSVRDQLFTRGPLTSDACEICAAILLAGVIAGVGRVLLIPALPLVVMLQQSFRHAQLLSEARVDADTGLLTATAWRAEAEVQLAQAQRTGSPVALAIIDLDQFKAVNDTHGWPTGDAVIVTTARILRDGLRASDLIGRFGGQEFIFLLPATTASEALQVAARLRGSLAAQPIPSERGGEPLHATVSIGVAATDGQASRDLADLLADADVALYRAKQSGRNAVHLAPGSTAGPAEPGPERQVAGDPVSERKEIVAARRELGRELAAWRKRATMSQRELSDRAGYSRSAVAEAESGGPRSRDFWAAIDRAVGAEGSLAARHAQLEMAVTAARRRRGRQAWKDRLEAAHPGLADAVPQDGTIAVTDTACPHCGEPIALASHVTTTVIGQLTPALKQDLSHL